MSEGRKTLLLVLIFTLVIGGWSIFYNTTWNRNMAQYEADNLSNREEIKQMDQLIAKEQDIRDSLAEDYYLIVPKVSGLANLHDYIYTVGDKYNIELSSINFNSQKSDVASELSSVTFDFMVAGKYLDVRAFMQEIYQSQRLLKLVDWSWLNGDEGILEMDLVYNSYFYTNETEEFLELPKLDVYGPAERVNPID